MTTEQIHKEIDLVQNVILQMSKNSFRVKSWMVAIFGGVIAFTSDGLFLSSEENNIFFLFSISLALIIIITVFWYLDAFYLHKEKIYRALYHWNISYRNETSKYLYDLNTFKRDYKGTEVDFVKETEKTFFLMFSKTLIPFYFLPLAFSITLFIYSF